jgi:hypothetical protein
MATQTKQAATNDRIVSLLNDVKAELAESKKRELQISRDLARLLGRK